MKLQISSPGVTRLLEALDIPYVPHGRIRLQYNCSKHGETVSVTHQDRGAKLTTRSDSLKLVATDFKHHIQEVTLVKPDGRVVQAIRATDGVIARGGKLRRLSVEDPDQVHDDLISRAEKVSLALHQLSRVASKPSVPSAG